jgi:glycosyltransferase involved in cell wall biosynthesis
VGGAEKRFIEVLKAWSTEKVNVTIVDSNPSLIFESHTNFMVVGMPSPLPFSGRNLTSIYFDWALWIIKACFRCPLLVRRKRYDVILAPNNTLPNVIVSYLLHVVSGAPLCVVVHHMDFPFVDTPANFASVYKVYRKARFSVFAAFAKALAFFMILIFLKRSNACIAVSKYTAKLLQKNGVLPGRVHISGNGVDTDLIARFEASEKLYDAIFVGRVSRDKGVFDLVRMWDQIVQNNSESKLLIVGTGPDLEDLKKLAEKSGISSRIIFAGRCEDSELYSLMKSSKIFLFPSRFEGWGLAVGEALACGLPVVSYDIPALREIFGECKSVFLVPIGNIRKFTETAAKILENGNFAAFEKISKEYIKRFNWEEVGSKDLEIISALAQQRVSKD